MANLIDSTYFINDIIVPTSSDNSAVLTTFITKYEREVLIKLFGYELYKLVAAYENPGSTQRIIDIVEGKEYTVGSTTIKWNGLINDEKISLIAYYVYYYWMRNLASTSSLIGEIISNSDNAINVSIDSKLSYSWHKCFELYGGVNNKWDSESCYNFLVNNESTYPEWEFKELGSVNLFNL